MKVKFIQINHDEIFVHNNKVVNVGDIVDLPKERAEHYVARGKAEVVKEAPKKSKKKNSNK